MGVAGLKILPPVAIGIADAECVALALALADATGGGRAGVLGVAQDARFARGLANPDAVVAGLGHDVVAPGITRGAGAGDAAAVRIAGAGAGALRNIVPAAQIFAALLLGVL